MTALVAREISVRYGETQAVRGVSLELCDGQFVALTGESGAGKSSLLWALAGATAYDGSITLDGAPAHPAAGRIALMPQTNGLAAMLTAQENIAYPLLALGVAPQEALERTRDALSGLGLDGFGDHLADELSGGQQQRVALARALAGRPPVLLVDEPTSALDPANRVRVLEALAAAARGGAVVLMASHDPEAAQAADAEAAMDEGVLTWTRPLGSGGSPASEPPQPAPPDRSLR